MTDIDHALKHYVINTITMDELTFKCVYPKLHCQQCSNVSPDFNIRLRVGVDDYYTHLKESRCWWDNDVVEQFGRMLYHTTHHSNIIYVDCTMATSTSSTVPIYLSTEIQQIVSVGNLNGHFVLIHIKLHQIEVIIYDGLGSIPSHHWNPYVKYILSRYGFGSKCDQFIAKMRMHNDTDLDGVNVSQKDSYNCGPIACMIMWYFFIPREVDLTVDVEEYRSKIILKLKKC